MASGQEDLIKPCPNCGHCPTCGRQSFQLIGIIPYPYQFDPLLYPQGPIRISWPNQWVNPAPTWTITYSTGYIT